MPTKTKKTNTRRGRPRKEFKPRPKQEPSVKRGRGRPRKHENINNLNTIDNKISKHKTDIKKISQNNTKIQTTIKNTTFSNKKIKNDKDAKSDRFALGLLIFSMLLFIFSLYKTFYLKPYTGDLTNNIDNGIYIDSGISTIIYDVSNTQGKKTEHIGSNLIKNVDTDYNLDAQRVNNSIMEDFYGYINNQNYGEIYKFADNYMKKSSLFRIYYSKSWLEDFLNSLTNERVYITNVKELPGKTDKEWVHYYSYDLKYKLKNNNQLFTEKWEVAIVDQDGKKLIGSMQCINTGCSKMPFFYPQKYGIK